MGSSGNGEWWKWGVVEMGSSGDGSSEDESASNEIEGSVRFKYGTYMVSALSVAYLRRR